MKKQKNIFLRRFALLCVLSFQFGFVTTLLAQNAIVTGKVIDANQQPLPGVSVIVKGGNQGVSTNIDGEYSIKAGESDVLTFSFVGMEKQEIAVKNKKTINVKLTEDSKNLEEVIVVGYGVQKKSLVTGAISSISAKEFERPGLMRADEVLQGKAAGVTVMSNSGQPGEGLTVRIRGIGTNGNATPLYIVDGMSSDNIEFLNPRDIESIEVLKDAASSAIYGARGANGVVMITTKKGKLGDKMSIRYDGSYGIQNLRKKMDMLDARSYAIIQNEAAFNSNQTLPFSTADIAKLGKGTDWQEEILPKFKC